MNRSLVSALLSLVLPGAGQVYNRDYGKGIVIVAIAALLFTLGGISPLTVAAGVFIWIFGIVDAYRKSMSDRVS